MIPWNTYWANWKWRIIVQKVKLDESRGVPRILRSKPIGIIELTTGNQQQEDELLYTLTQPNSVLHKALEEDGVYRLVVLKETPSSKLRKSNPPVFAFWGYALVSKKKDIIFWESKYFHIGHLNPRVLKTRDPQEEIRRGHVGEIPGGGVDWPW